MDSTCSICGESCTSLRLLCCCLKSICPKHSFIHCPLCEKYAIIIPQFPIKCQRCTKSDSLQKCENCNAFLCGICSEEVHLKGKFKLHKINNCCLSFDNKCKIHLFPFSTFCETCGVGCSLCKCSHKRNEIRQHTLEISEKAKKMLEELDKKREKIKDEYKSRKNMRDEGLEQLETCKNKIIFDFKALESALNLKLAELLQTLNEVLSKTTDHYTKLFQDLAQSTEKVSIFIQFLEFSIKTPEFLYNIPEKSLSEMLSEPILSSSPFQIPDFSCNISSIKASIDSITLSSHATPSHYTLDSKSSKLPDFSPFRSPSSLSTSVLISETPYKKLDSHMQDLPPRPNSNSRSNQQNGPKSSKLLSTSLIISSADEALNMLFKREFTKLQQSSNALKISWTHPAEPQNSLEYILECSLDNEDFRQIYKGKLKTCIITDLQSSSLYYLRVVAVSESGKGEYSDVVSASTFEEQRINQRTLESVASCSNGEIEFKENGTILTDFPYLFGKHCLMVRLLPSLGTGILKIGVAEGENKTVIGRSVLYGKSEIVVRVILDLDNGYLVFYDSNYKEEDAIKIPLDCSLFGAVQYKAGKQQHSLKIKIFFGEDCVEPTA